MPKDRGIQYLSEVTSSTETRQRLKTVTAQLAFPKTNEILQQNTKGEVARAATAAAVPKVRWCTLSDLQKTIGIQSSNPEEKSKRVDLPPSDTRYYDLRTVFFTKKKRFAIRTQPTATVAV